jgi:hypothetical protein
VGSLPLTFIGPSRMEGMLSGVIRRCCPFNWDVTKQLSNSTQLKGAMAMLMQGRSVTAKHPFVACQGCALQSLCAPCVS